jgi:hypothetical protein
MYRYEETREYILYESNAQNGKERGQCDGDCRYDRHREQQVSVLKYKEGIELPWS